MSDLLVVDDHAHPVPLGYEPLPWGRLGLGPGPGPGSGVATPGPEPLYVEMLRRGLARLLGCAPEEVVEAREERAADWPAYVRLLARDVALGPTLLDGGPELLGAAELASYAELYDRPVHGIARVEAVADPLVAAGAGAREIADAVSSSLQDAAAHGSVSAKTVLAYRTGLQVDPGVTESDVDSARAAGDQKPLRDWLMRRVLGWCAELDLPIQVHSGFGDSDLRLATANPSGLQDLLRTPEGSAATVVLIHSAFPWHEEAAYLACVHPRLHLEMSLHAIFSPATTADRLLRILDLVPPGKLLTGSDGHVAPELQWFGLRTTLDAWDVVGSRLGDGVSGGQVSEGWFAEVRRAALAGNAERVYGLTP
jgi:predicted TIM-barrel fold metal-dependent hydrolase